MLLKRGIPASNSALVAFTAVLWLFTTPGVVFGGESTLRGFERDVTRASAPHDHNTDHDDDSNEEDSGGSFLSDFIWGMLGLGGSSDDESDSDAGTAMQASPPPSAQHTSVEVPEPVEVSEKVETPPEAETPVVEAPPNQPYVWQPGSGFTPRLRADYGLMRVSSRIGATIVNVEGGDDHMGFWVRDTLFEERDPDATLRVQNYFLLFRVAGNGGPELNLGLGGTKVSGEDENSGIAYVARLRAKSQEGWVFEGRHSGASINGNDLSDSEIGASLERPYVALTGGYRWLKSPHMLLDGPFVGISVRY